MINSLRFPIVFISVFLTGACNHEIWPIPSGFYHSETTDEQLVVLPDRFVFRIAPDAEQPDKLLERELKYHMYPESRHEIRFTWRPASAFSDVGLFDWHWRDGKIAMIRRETGQTTWFVKSDSI